MKELWFKILPFQDRGTIHRFTHYGVSDGGRIGKSLCECIDCDHAKADFRIQAQQEDMFGFYYDMKSDNNQIIAVPQEHLITSLAERLPVE